MEGGFRKISEYDYNLCNSHSHCSDVSTDYGTIWNGVLYHGLYRNPRIFLPWMRSDCSRTVSFFCNRMSQIIAAVLTFGVLFCSFVMEGIESFFSDTALSSMLAVLVLVVLLALVIYQMTKDALLSSVVGAGMGAVVLILYAVKASLFSGLIQKVLGLLAIANHFDNFVGGILDITGIVYMLSVICIFVFLTIQCIQKRRWS